MQDSRESVDKTFFGGTPVRVDATNGATVTINYQVRIVVDQIVLKVLAGGDERKDIVQGVVYP